MFKYVVIRQQKPVRVFVGQSVLNTSIPRIASVSIVCFFVKFIFKNFSYFVSAVYFLPIFGAILAEGFLGLMASSTGYILGWGMDGFVS